MALLACFTHPHYCVNRLSIYHCRSETTYKTCLCTYLKTFAKTLFCLIRNLSQSARSGNIPLLLRKNNMHHWVWYKETIHLETEGICIKSRDVWLNFSKGLFSFPSPPLPTTTTTTEITDASESKHVFQLFMVISKNPDTKNGKKKNNKTWRTSLSGGIYLQAEQTRLFNTFLPV